MFSKPDAAKSGSNLGRSLVDAFAAFWEGGEGPKHTIIDRKIAAAGMVPTSGSTKEQKIVDAFMAADERQAYTLMCGLLEALRKSSEGFYTSSSALSDNTTDGARLRKAIEAAGYALDANFELLDEKEEPVATQVTQSPSWERTKQPWTSKSADPWLPNPDAQVSQPTSALELTPKEKATITKAEVDRNPPKEIFLVHGHDELRLYKVSEWVQSLTGVKPIILSQQLNKGQTLIEKFESYSADSACAIVIMTPDDEARAKRDPDSTLIGRARENVVFELGYFYGKLKRENVIVLNFGVPLPGDINGLVYIGEAEWKVELGAELAGLGYSAHL